MQPRFRSLAIRLTTLLFALAVLAVPFQPVTAQSSDPGASDSTVIQGALSDTNVHTGVCSSVCADLGSTVDSTGSPGGRVALTTSATALDATLDVRLDLTLGLRLDISRTGSGRYGARAACHATADPDSSMGETRFTIVTGSLSPVADSGGGRLAEPATTSGPLTPGPDGDVLVAPSRTRHASSAVRRSASPGT